MLRLGVAIAGAVLPNAMPPVTPTASKKERSGLRQNFLFDPGFMGWEGGTVLEPEGLTTNVSGELITVNTMPKNYLA